MAEQLTPKQSRALLALLTHSSLKDAGQAVGASEKTLWRWMQLPHFIAALRTAQREALDSAILELQAASLRAVKKLVANLDSANDFASNNAAVAILSNALKGREQSEILKRIDELTTMLESLERERRNETRSVENYRATGSRFGR